MHHLTNQTTPLTVLCPLEFERSLLRAAGVDKFATVLCTGPGQHAVATCVEQLNDAPGMIMLIGVAGGVSRHTRAGEAHLVTTVRSAEDDRHWKPRVHSLPGLDLPSCTVWSVDQPITTVHAKRDVFAQSKADIVDTESLGFAQACMKRGFHWGIIRGISDGPEQALPPPLLQCVDEHGRSKTARSMMLAMRHPTLVPIMMRLRTNSVRSMKRGAEMLRVLNESMQ